MRTALSLLALSPAAVLANDPAGSWLSYARYDAPAEGIITALNTTWTVPSMPATSRGSNAPGWWFGVMDKNGDGALVQPILAYGYMGNVYTIFNGVFDWTPGGGWHTSPKKLTVKPGDKITSSVTYNKRDNSYTMLIASAALGETISTDYTLLRRQTKNESSAVFVLEHQPRTCKAYPTSGEMSFENIYVEVDYKPVAAPAWEALQERPACSSKAEVVDSATIKITWDPSAEVAAVAPVEEAEPMEWPAKWGLGEAA